MASSPSSAVKLFGTEEPPAETRVLRAGPLSVELDAGNLRYIRYAGQEAIRAVSYVVRDQYWGTFNAEIENFRVEEGDGGFTVSYDATCSDAGQSFRYAARITGSPDGSLTFEGIGAGVTDFVTNRTGFVVLHAVEGVSGSPVEVEHVDGTVEHTVFPAVIDPKQPIMDIRSLTHQVAPGLEVTCTMEGDTYEMEDQRNWTDASYKTYVRPLALPMPYTLAAGESFRQAVTLRFAADAAAGAAGSGAGPGADATVSVSLGGPEGRLPAFAMAVEGQDVAAALAQADALGSLMPAYLSCYLDAREAVLLDALADFRRLGERLGVHLALEAVLPGTAPPAEELAELARQAEAAGASFGALAVTTADELGFVAPGTVFPDSSDFDALYAAVRAAFPEARLGGGSFVYFTELNRKPPPFAQLDFVCHTTCAIVHAADDRSVAETIEALPYVVASARALFGDRPYQLGPAGIGTRTSPFGGGPVPNPQAKRVTMTHEDPRQRGLLGAAWHLGYAARAAAGGVDAVVLGAPVGAFGLVHHRFDFAQPWYDDAGGLYPAYHVMRALYAASGAERLATDSSTPRNVQALAWRGAGGGVELWLANLSSEAQRVEVSGLELSGARVALLDEANFETCAGDVDGLDVVEGAAEGGAVALGPYAVARVRG